MTKSHTKNHPAYLLIFLTWIVYTTSYISRANYSASITQVIDFYGVTKSQAGIVPSFFFFAYGIGQVVNGILSKRYNIKWTIFISLVVSAVINFVIATTTTFAIIKWLWMINGFVLSILWPTIIRTIADSVPKKDLSFATATMGTPVAVGTLVIYALSSLYAAFNMFKLSFYTASFLCIVVSFLWLTCYKNATITSATMTSNTGTINLSNGKVTYP